MTPYDPTETRRLASLHNARLAPPLPDDLLARIAALEKSRPKRTSTDRMREKRARDREEAPPLEPKSLATNSNAIRQRRWRDRRKAAKEALNQKWLADAYGAKAGVLASIPIPPNVRMANRVAQLVKVFMHPYTKHLATNLNVALCLARLESLMVGSPNQGDPTDPTSDFQPKMPDVLDLG